MDNTLQSEGRDSLIRIVSMKASEESDSKKIAAALSAIAEMEREA